MVFPLGAFINAVAVVLGALLGMSIGRYLSDRLKNVVFQAIGLCVLAIAIKLAIGTEAPIVMVLSILIGGLIGESIDIEKRFVSLGNRLRTLIGSKNPQFTNGLVTATFLFCSGAMAILASIEDGVTGGLTIAVTKSVMDFFSTIALASVYGFGTAFSGLFIFLYQGLITIGAQSLQHLITPDLLQELSAVGGIMVMGIGLNLLKIMEIRVSNFIPAFFVFAILYPLHNYILQ